MQHVGQAAKAAGLLLHITHYLQNRAVAVYGSCPVLYARHYPPLQSALFLQAAIRKNIFAQSVLFLLLIRFNSFHFCCQRLQSA